MHCFKRGFTFVEMMVVIGIFFVVFVMALGNFRSNEWRSRFTLATENIASDLRRMQNQTLTGLSSDEIEPTGGYGIYLDLTNPTEYILFRDDGDETYEALVDTVLETVELPDFLSLNDLQLDTNTTNQLSIVFKPPRSEVYFNDALANEAQIFLSHSEVSAQVGRVTINKYRGKINSAVVSN